MFATTLERTNVATYSQTNSGTQVSAISCFNN